MANTPKKMKDPTEAALSAIQDALNVPDHERRPHDEHSQSDAVDLSPEYVPEPAPQWSATRASAVEPPFHDDEVRRPEDMGSLRRPANDDRESIGQILRSLQRRPARTSYLVATVFAVAWVFAGIVLGWIYLPDLKASLGPSGLTAPILGVLGAMFFLPIIFFYVLAHMAWRCGRESNRKE